MSTRAKWLWLNVEQSLLIKILIAFVFEKISVLKIETARIRVLSGSPGAHNGQKSGLKCVFRLYSDWRLPSTWLNAGSIFFLHQDLKQHSHIPAKKMKMWDIANFTLFPSRIFMGQSKTHRERLARGAVNVLCTLYYFHTSTHPTISTMAGIKHLQTKPRHRHNIWRVWDAAIYG